MTFEQLATDFEKNPKKLCGVTINPKSTAVSSTATMCALFQALFWAKKYSWIKKVLGRRLRGSLSCSYWESS